MVDQTEPVKRTVALKLIRVDRNDSKMILSRFEAERQAIALMDHPNIARLLDAGSTDAGQPFFVMEFVKGVPLTKFCDGQKLSVPERLGLFLQICSAVQHAHQKGVIHRDLKPTNILVETHDGKPVPKVIDFGLAKATSGMKLTDHTQFTAFGYVMGTPMYMAPEQATFNAVDVDTRADVYSLGVILFELLTGTTPISHETVKTTALDELLKFVREEEVPKPSTRLRHSGAMPGIAANRDIEPAHLSKLLRGDLDWVVLKALEKDRTRRDETANGLAADVLRYLSNEPVVARPLAPLRILRGHDLARSVALKPALGVIPNDVMVALLSQQSASIDTGEMPWSLAYCPKTNEVFSGGNSQIHVCDFKTVTRTSILSTGADISGYVHDVAVSPDGRYVVAIGGPIGQSVLIFDRQSPKNPAKEDK